MKLQGTRVLVLDGYGRQVLPLIKRLSMLGCITTTVNASKLDPGYTTRYVNRKIVEPEYRRNEEVMRQVIDREVLSDLYDVAFPMLEYSTKYVAQNADRFADHIAVAAAPYDAFNRAYDKQITFECAMRNNIPCPYTRLGDQSIDDYVTHAHFPIIIKPRKGLGSIGFHKFENERAFRDAINTAKIDVDDYVVQEFVPFKKRFSTYIFMDSNGEVCSSLNAEVLRWYPLDAGTSTLNRTVDNPEAIELAAKLLRVLKWRGFADVNFMFDERTHTSKLLEINGRIPAGVKLAIECGIDISKQYMQFALSQQVDKYPSNAVFGQMVCHSQPDLMWFIKSPDRFRSEPSWFNKRKTKDLVFSWDDPVPYFAYSLQMLLKVKESAGLRKHNI